jgi:polysaccharide export outer membrane protein
MMWPIKTLLVVLAVVAVTVAQEAPTQAATPVPAERAANSSDATHTGAGNVPQLQERYPRYRIQSGDQFDVNFELSPEFNQTAVTVQPDGFATLRGVGDVHVEGQTIPEMTQTLIHAYGKILHDPIVSVVLKDFQKPYFVADGQVGRPGKYDLRGETTLTQAIAMAGGFTDYAKHSQVLLFRRVSDQWTEATIFNVKKMEKQGNLKEDPFLHPGDMLFVPKNAFSKFQKFLPNPNVGAYIPVPIP